MPDVGTYVEVAGSNAPVVNEDGSVGGRVVHLRFTHASASPLSVTLNSVTMKKLSGKWILKLRSLPGAVPVTNSSHLTLTDSDGYSFLGLNGTSFLTSGTVQETKFYNSFLGLNEYGFVESSEPLVVSTSGNSVSGATFDLKFYLV